MSLMNKIRGYAKVRLASDSDKYQTIAANNAGTAAAVKIGTGEQGDYLESLLCVVVNNLAAKVDILDGGTTINVLPAALGDPGNRTIHIPLGISAINNNWSITTGTGVSVIARGVW